MEESLSVGNLFALVGDALDPVLDQLGRIGWNVGDWTLFLPVAFPFLYWLGLKIVRRHTGNRPYFRIALLGLVLGGVLEHFQPALEACIANGVTSCF